MPDPVVSDQNADALFRQHHQWLQRWLQRKVRSQMDAEDLAQDVFVRLIGSPDVGRLDEPRAFLTTLAKRVLCNFWRRQALEQAYLDALAQQPEMCEPSAEALAVIRQAIGHLDTMFAALPIPVRHAFLLSRLEGLTHHEIAGQMALSVATVERYIKQAFLHCYLAQQSTLKESAA